MPYDIDTEPILITVPAQTVAPGGNVTAAEWLDYKNRVAAVEGLGIVDLSDVNLAGLADGMVLEWNAATERWKATVSQAGIDRLLSWDAAFDQTGLTNLQFFRPFTVQSHPTLPYRAVVGMTFGTAINTVAEGNHVHSLPGIMRLDIPASGALSSSSRTLVSGTRSGLTPDNSYQISAELTGDLQGQGTGAGYTVISITINGVTQSRFQRVRTVAGVPREYSLTHAGVSVTGVSSVGVSATIAWSEGDPIDVQAGELIIHTRSNR